MCLKDGYVLFQIHNHSTGFRSALLIVAPSTALHFGFVGLWKNGYKVDQETIIQNKPWEKLAQWVDLELAVFMFKAKYCLKSSLSKE